MANSRNDDLDRIGNRQVPQGSTQDNRPGTGGPGSTSQGQGGNFNQGTTDPVNRDREMNRDRQSGGSSGNMGSTRERDSSGSFGSTERDRESERSRDSELGRRDIPDE